MITNQIAKRYAKTIFGLAVENNRLEKIYQNLQSLINLFQESEEFGAFINNPTIPRSTQAKIIKQLFEGKFQEDTVRFLEFLAHKERLSELKHICYVFEELYLDHAQQVNANIISAIDLTNAQITAICGKLKNYYHKTVNPAIEVDQNLLGGFIVEIEGRIFDFSVKTQLTKFREAVLSA
jgi:F-type H+-transporting ATPase subunit delta